MRTIIINPTKDIVSDEGQPVQCAYNLQVFCTSKCSAYNSEPMQDPDTTSFSVLTVAKCNRGDFLIGKMKIPDE